MFLSCLCAIKVSHKDKRATAQALRNSRSGPSSSQNTRSASREVSNAGKQQRASASVAGAIAPRPAFALATFLLLYFLAVDCIRRFAFAVGFVVTSKPKGPAGAWLLMISASERISPSSNFFLRLSTMANVSYAL